MRSIQLLSTVVNKKNFTSRSTERIVNVETASRDHHVQQANLETTRNERTEGTQGRAERINSSE